MITTFGKDIITRFFALETPRIGASIALGVGTAAPSLADSKLGLEVIRMPLTAVAADLGTSRVVFKGSLPPGRLAKIYEVGLFHEGLVASATQQFGLLNGGVTTWDTGTFVDANARRGTTSLKIDAGASATVQSSINNIGLNLSNYASTDSVVLGFTADADTASVHLCLGTDATNYREFIYNAPAVGYNVMRVNLSAGTDYGVVDLSQITYADLRVTAKAAGGTSVYIDGIGIEDNRAADGLVARTVLGAPVTVDTTIATDIEYSLAVSL